MFIRKVKVIEVEKFRDGGTTKYEDKAGEAYFVDNRLKTKTKGAIFDKYPSEAGACKLTVELEIVTDLWSKATL